MSEGNSNSEVPPVKIGLDDLKVWGQGVVNEFVPKKEKVSQRDRLKKAFEKPARHKKVENRGPIAGGAEDLDGYDKLVDLAPERFGSFEKELRELKLVFGNLIERWYGDDNKVLERVKTAFKNGNLDVLYKLTENLREVFGRDGEFDGYLLKGSVFERRSQKTLFDKKKLAEDVRGYCGGVFNTLYAIKRKQGVDPIEWKRGLDEVNMENVVTKPKSPLPQR